jgi:GNAT superfamily N-acetyltransferase
MNIQISLLKDHHDSIPVLTKIWHEALGKIWCPEIRIQEIESWYHEWLNHDIPLAYIALYDGIPVGACSLQLNDGIRPDLAPWLGDLVVEPKYQKQGIGKMLLDVTVEKAKELGFETLYLFAFDQTIHFYYEKLGWYKIAEDEFKGHPVTVMEIKL